jgi:hypothetical protein
MAADEQEEYHQVNEYYETFSIQDFSLNWYG